MSLYENRLTLHPTEENTMIVYHEQSVKAFIKELMNKEEIANWDMVRTKDLKKIIKDLVGEDLIE